MKITYLEMLAARDLVPASREQALTLKQVEPVSGEVNQRFYREVGQGWNWTDRAGWTTEQWQAYVNGDPLGDHGHCR